MISQLARGAIERTLRARGVLSIETVDAVIAAIDSRASGAVLRSVLEFAGVPEDESIDCAFDLQAAVQAAQPRVATHVRVVDRRPSRRIGGTRGASHNLCGAAPTDRDIEFHDAGALSHANQERWISCVTCLEQLRATAVRKSVTR